MQPFFKTRNGGRENVLVRGVEPVALAVHDEVRRSRAACSTRRAARRSSATASRAATWAPRSARSCASAAAPGRWSGSSRAAAPRSRARSGSTRASSRATRSARCRTPASACASRRAPISTRWRAASTTIRAGRWRPSARPTTTTKQSESANTLYFIVIGLAVLAGIGAIFGAANTMYAAVQARTAEIGTLRALGFSRGTILGAFLIESLVMAAAGFAVGAVLAAGARGDDLELARRRRLRGRHLHDERDRAPRRPGRPRLRGAALAGDRARRRLVPGAARGAAAPDRSAAAGPERCQRTRRRARKLREDLAALRIDRSEPPARAAAALARARGARRDRQSLFLLAVAPGLALHAGRVVEVEVGYAQRAAPGARAERQRADRLGLRRDRRPLHLARRARAGPHRGLSRRGGRARREGTAAGQLDDAATRPLSPRRARRCARRAPRRSSPTRSWQGSRSCASATWRRRRSSTCARRSSRCRAAGAARLEARVAQLELDLEDTVLRAPTDGVVLEKLKEVGEIAVPGGFAGSGDLIRMANTRRAPRRGRRQRGGPLEGPKLGQPAQVVPDAYPDKRYAARGREALPADRPPEGDAQGRGADPRARRGAACPT